MSTFPSTKHTGDKHMAKTKGQRESETNTESSNLRGTIQRLERVITLTPGPRPLLTR